MNERIEWPAVRSGVLNGVVFALPLAILAQLAVGDDDGGTSALGWLLYLLVLFCLVFTGWVAARRVTETPYTTGALASLGTFVVVQAVGIVTLSIRGESIPVVAIVFNGLIAYGCGLLGAGLVVKQRAMGRF